MQHPTFKPVVDQALRARLEALCAAGWDFFERFEAEVRDRRFHPFIASEYEVVLDALLAHRGPGQRFLELGSASGVITIMADLLGYDACGIEIDESLVATARELARRFASGARFVEGSFFPAGYVYRPRDGSGGAVPLGDGLSGYVQLGHALDDFDVVFGFPWGGEEAMMLDLMRCYGRADATLLLHGVEYGVKAFRGGRELSSQAGC
jgi:SAM-dependent methyltransferase